ncbi:MAG TPA: LLM class flavin-dependent oxidoreductase [Actinomycetales bacterium]|nr:LLM class flavin-dependent oxidoreductase [Actinomycetales bacterium]
MSRDGFRFDVVATPYPTTGSGPGGPSGFEGTTRPGGRAWADDCRRFESLGFTAVLVPDTLNTPSPFPVLAAAAAATSDLHVSPWVLAAPLRSTPATVREVAALQLLSDGRFDLGLGTGRPGAEDEAAALGVPWGTPAERIEQLLDVVAAVREHLAPAPPVTVAARGRRLLTSAARVADAVAMALAPQADASEVKAVLDVVRGVERPSGEPVEVVLQLVGAGGRLVQWIARQTGLDAGSLASAGAVAVLGEEKDAMVDGLLERRELLGINRFVVPAELADVLAPVIAALPACTTP